MPHIQKLLKISVGLLEREDQLLRSLVVLDVLEIELEVGDQFDDGFVKHHDVVMESLEPVVEFHVKFFIQLLDLLDVPEDPVLGDSINQLERTHRVLEVTDDEGNIVEVGLLGFDQFIYYLLPIL